MTTADACSKHDESLREETYGNGTGVHSGTAPIIKKRHMCHSVPKLWHSESAGISTIYKQTTNVPLFFIYVFILFVLCCVLWAWNGTAKKEVKK
jgi:hypothetical protein